VKMSGGVAGSSDAGGCCREGREDRRAAPTSLTSSMAAWAPSASVKVTKPKPRGRPVSLSRGMKASST
jgi:hypothetical protein